MEPIKVGRHIGPYGEGDIMANLSENGIINIWINYDEAKQRPRVSVTSEEWDRLVAWIGWQQEETTLERKQTIAEEDK